MKKIDYFVLGFGCSCMTAIFGVLAVGFATNDQKIISSILGTVCLAFGATAVDNIKSFIKSTNNQKTR